MGFGGLSGGERLNVMLRLEGAAKYISEMRASSEASLNLALANKKAAYEAKQLTHHTWLQNQALYTARRYAFYATLAVTGLAFAVARLGFSYLNALQTTRVALRPLFASGKAMEAIIHQLYTIATLSPFLFKDMTLAFRSMYPAFKLAGIGAQMTVNTLKSVTDAMSLAGRTAPGQLNRVSVALQHMALMGRPLGFTVTQLDRLGVPFSAALKAKYHFTAEQLHNIASSGLTARDAIQALNEFIQKSPAFKDAALRQSQKTLSGNWAQFKDILSQAAGNAEGGLFGGLTKTFAAINNQLAPMMKANKPISIYNVIDAIDKHLSPSTHLIMNMYQLLTGIVQGVVFQFGALLKVIQLILWPFGKLLGTGRLNEFVFRNLGRIIAVLIVLYTIMRVRLILTTAAIEYMRIQTFTLAAATKVLALANIDLEAALLRTMYAWDSLSLSMLANPYVLLAVAILAVTAGLVILYFKFKPFRDLVNWFWDHPLAMWFIPGIGPMAVMLKLIIGIVNQLEKLAHYGSSIGHFFGHLSHYTPLGIASNFIGHANGGHISSGGMTWVGEHGPELASFPVGTRIIPNSQLGSFGGGSMPEIYVTVMPQSINLDKVKFAEIISTVKTDTRARS